MKFKLYILVLFLMVSLGIRAQDTIKIITLPDFIVHAQKDPEYEKKYQKLVYNVKKALPYAKLAAFRYQMLEQNLQLLPTEKARKAYLKKTEANIKDQFMDDLKGLTVSQGKILIKLVYRETGRTTYDLLESYRGSFTAYFWQGLTKFYGGNLKDEYNPVEDWQIEQIIKQLGFE